MSRLKTPGHEGFLLRPAFESAFGGGEAKEEDCRKSPGISASVRVWSGGRENSTYDALHLVLAAVSGFIRVFIFHVPKKNRRPCGRLSVTSM